MAPSNLSYGLHHPRFAIDEEVLSTGVALHAHLALSSLGRQVGDATTSGAMKSYPGR